jgi:hypothetical protein
MLVPVEVLSLRISSSVILLLILLEWRLLTSLRASTLVATKEIKWVSSLICLYVSLELLATHGHPHHLISTETIVHSSATKLILLESVLLLHLTHHHLLHHKLLLLLVHTSHTTAKCVSIELICTAVHASHKVHWITLRLLSSHKALQIRHKTSFRLT